MSKLAKSSHITIFTNAIGDQFVTVGVQYVDDSISDSFLSVSEQFVTTDSEAQSILIEANKLLASLKTTKGIS